MIRLFLILIISASFSSCGSAPVEPVDPENRNVEYIDPATLG